MNQNKEKTYINEGGASLSPTSKGFLHILCKDEYIFFPLWLLYFFCFLWFPAPLEILDLSHSQRWEFGWGMSIFWGTTVRDKC